MKIDVWSDIICAWCGIGNHRLKTALDRLPSRQEVEVVHHHFQLDPSSPVGQVTDNYSMLQARGLSPSRAHDVLTSVEHLAAAEGLKPYNVLRSPIGNTQLAHELLALAADHGVGPQAWQALYDACFTDGRPFFDVRSLTDLAVGLGLDEDVVTDALLTHRYADRVRRDQQDATERGARGVPFFVIDRRYTLAGAQSPDVLVKLLERAGREARQDLLLTATEGQQACHSNS